MIFYFAGNERELIARYIKGRNAGVLFTFFDMSITQLRRVKKSFGKIEKEERK